MNQDANRKNKIIAIGIIVVMALVSVIIFRRVGTPLVEFVMDGERFGQWVDQYGVWSRLAYMGMVVLQILVAVIPGEPFEIAGGYAFGAIEGTILCVVASWIGSIFVFSMVRAFGTKLVQIFFPLEKINSYRFLKNDRKRDLLFFVLFFIPGTPKDILCYVAGLTNMKFGTWCIIALMAKLPSIVTSTVGGDALGEGAYVRAIVVFVITAIISLTGAICYNGYIKKKEREHQSQDKD